MQLIATEGGVQVYAAAAEKRRDYFCPECAGIVRLRSGPHRQPHFYHPKADPRCRQCEKSAEHIAAQAALLALLPNSSVEHPFPDIDRIADVVWPEQKIVFEIQCSPISLEEVQERIADYASCGFTCLWILHEKTFNQRRLSAAESHLRTVGCYFTDINQKGNGLFYDQYEILLGPRRTYRGPPLPVNFLEPPQRQTKLLPPEPSLSLKKIYKRWLRRLLASLSEPPQGDEVEEDRPAQ